MRRCCNGAAEERSDLTRRRGVEAEVSRWQIPREVTTAWDEQQLWGGTTPCWGSGRLRCRWTTARFERILSSLGLLRSGAAAASDGESLSSISAVWLRVAWVPARSRRQKSSSTTTRASRATGSPGEASVSPPALGLLLRFGRSGSAVRFGSGVRTAHTGELGRRGGRPRWRTSATTGRRRSARPSPQLWSSSFSTLTPRTRRAFATPARAAPPRRRAIRPGVLNAFVDQTCGVAQFGHGDQRYAGPRVARSDALGSTGRCQRIFPAARSSASG